MRLRFLCNNHRNWLESDSGATHASWLRSYNQAGILFHAGEELKAVNYAGCALEAAELLVFTHARRAAADIHRFTDSAVLLCHSLLGAEQPRLVCGVIGGTIARLEELLLHGSERAAVLQSCQRMLTALDANPIAVQPPPERPEAVAPGWSVH
ncbi:MAG: hypothetical protein H6988_08775 [Pseudomonadales bacterium]|nr:hypothetical protein [Pseudomonadales bacterium]MCP5190473.1 hypothetical protein [Pseudomonadales bacterium]